MTSIALPKSPVSKTLSLPFNVAVSGPLLFAVLYYPEKLRSILPKLLRPYVDSPRLIKTLKYLVGLALIRNVNSYLSQRVVNNWQNDAKFIKSQELVLVTGGASGMYAFLNSSSKSSRVLIFQILLRYLVVGILCCLHRHVKLTHMFPSGESIAEGFAKKGTTVVIFDVSPPKKALRE